MGLERHPARSRRQRDAGQPNAHFMKNVKHFTDCVPGRCQHACPPSITNDETILQRDETKFRAARSQAET